ncbi:MAG: hypothetical protein ACLTZY_09465 [Alistipes indistinctus]
MIVASADLSNSDKTDGFLKKTRAISKEGYGRPLPAAGRVRIYDGLHHERYGPARRNRSGLRYSSSSSRTI